MLCNIYAPNETPIKGGDLNVAFSEVMVRLHFKNKLLYSSQRRHSRDYFKTIRKYALFELLRIAHPTERSYFIFSPPHYKQDQTGVYIISYAVCNLHQATCLSHPPQSTYSRGQGAR